MKILFTICGRAGSKGIKNKNIRDFLGSPLPLYTLSAIALYLQNASGITADIAVNTDSAELADIMKKSKLADIELVCRKKELGGDFSSKIEVIKDTFLEMSARKRCEYDIVVDLDITSPLRTVNDLENLIQKKKKVDCDVVFSVTEARRNPYFNMVKKGESGYERVMASNLTARQQAPEVYDMNASMYAYSPKFLRSDKGIFDGKCEIIKMYDTGILDLDHENDFVLMQIIAEYLFMSNAEYRVIAENIEKIKA